jgi:hypothetical protein
MVCHFHEMTELTFQQLNIGWGADPNAPYVEINLRDDALHLSFVLNSWADAAEREIGIVLFFWMLSLALGRHE